MFKNPLKYQSSGSTPTQQQQDQLVQLFQAAAQNAQVDPEALVKKVQELEQDENAAAQFMEGLQRCAQGDPAGIQFIKSLFTSSHKRGGKIQDFICKHARGGQVAGCGCEKHVEKAQSGLGNLGFKYLGENSYQDVNNPQQHNILSHGYEINGETVSVPTPEGAYRMGINPENIGAYNNGKQVYSKAALDRIRDFYENKLPQSMVIKGQNAIPGGMPRFQVVRDTTYTNPANRRIMEQVIVGPNGQAYRRTTENGINPITIGGYWNGQFTPEGDVTIPNNRFDSLFRKAIPKNQNNTLKK